MELQTRQSTELVELTARIVAVYVENNNFAVADLPKIIASVHATLYALGDDAQAVSVETAPLVPAVPIKKSVTPEYIVCLEDGKQFKSMKRHLATNFGMTPDEYRSKWGLPKDYPMVAVEYSARRSALALSLGLGRKKAQPVEKPAAPAAMAPVKKSRAKKARPRPDERGAP